MENYTVLDNISEHIDFASRHRYTDSKSELFQIPNLVLKGLFNHIKLSYIDRYKGN